MSDDEQRDQVHVEQHEGSGDVHIEAPADDDSGSDSPGNANTGEVIEATDPPKE